MQRLGEEQLQNKRSFTGNKGKGEYDEDPGRVGETEITKKRSRELEETYSS